MLAVSRHLNLLNCLVWDKEIPGLTERWRHSWEAILEASLGPPRCWHGGNGRRNVLRHPRPAPTDESHPTPKPVSLLAELLRAASNPGSLVLDPFGGAGSTLLAAERTGRSCRLVEIEPRYCDLALARWERLSGEQARKVDGDE